MAHGLYDFLTGPLNLGGARPPAICSGFQLHATEIRSCAISRRLGKLQRKDLVATAPGTVGNVPDTVPGAVATGSSRLNQRP
jgi:hypothetical protein